MCNFYHGKITYTMGKSMAWYQWLWLRSSTFIDCSVFHTGAATDLTAEKEWASTLTASLFFTLYWNLATASADILTAASASCVGITSSSCYTWSSYRGVCHTPVVCVSVEQIRVGVHSVALWDPCIVGTTIWSYFASIIKFFPKFFSNDLELWELTMTCLKSARSWYAMAVTSYWCFCDNFLYSLQD